MDEAFNDMLLLGTGIVQGDQRVDPEDFFVQPDYDFGITHSKFCEWFDEIESYSSRAERLYEDFPYVKNLKLLRGWMEAAFSAGYVAGNIKQPKVYVDVEV